jgi:hypothetical protein
MRIGAVAVYSVNPESMSQSSSVLTYLTSMDEAH